MSFGVVASTSIYRCTCNCMGVRKTAYSVNTISSIEYNRLYFVDKKHLTIIILTAQLVLAFKLTVEPPIKDTATACNIVCIANHSADEFMLC